MERPIISFDYAIKDILRDVIRGHKKGHSIDTIAEFTGLATEQIIKILKENGLM